MRSSGHMGDERVPVKRFGPLGVDAGEQSPDVVAQGQARMARS